MKITATLLSLILISGLTAQDGAILPGQKPAIRSLATTAGFFVYPRMIRFRYG